MKHSLRFFVLAAASLAYACTPSSSVEEEPIDAPVVEDPAPIPLPDVTPEPSETIGGDGSEINLETLRMGDLDGLGGELGCSFAATVRADALLVAKGVVQGDEPNYGRIRNNGYMEHIASQERGYDSMVEGAKFSGKGLTLTITTRDEIETGNESNQLNASLLVQRADGAERTIEGVWTCGP